MPNLTTSSHSTLTQQITSLTEKLKPIDHDTVARALTTMQTAGMIMPTNIKPEDVEKVYTFALEGVPATGLKIATQKLVRGEYEIERGFIPRPPELAAMARAETKTLRDDLARLRLTQQSLQDAQPAEKMDEAAKERIRAMLGRFRAEHKASKAIEKAPETLTDEHAEYYRKIMALNDAREVGHENLAFRSKINSLMPTEERNS